MRRFPTLNAILINSFTNPKFSFHSDSVSVSLADSESRIERINPQFPEINKFLPAPKHRHFLWK
jgi:hypothetical protein